MCRWSHLLPPLNKETLFSACMTQAWWTTMKNTIFNYILNRKETLHFCFFTVLWDGMLSCLLISQSKSAIIFGKIYNTQEGDGQVCTEKGIECDYISLRTHNIRKSSIHQHLSSFFTRFHVTHFSLQILCIVTLKFQWKKSSCSRFCMYRIILHSTPY